MRKKTNEIELALAFVWLIWAPQALCAEYAAVDDSSTSEKSQDAPDIAPPNPDAMRQLAAKQAANGRFALTLDTIEHAQSLAPFDNDIALARARILLWSGRVVEPQKQADVVRVRAPTYPDLKALYASINTSMAQRSARSGFALSAGIAQVQLDGGQSQNWENLVLSVFTDIDANTNVTAIIEQELRRVKDTRLSLLTTHIGKLWDIRAGFTYTPSADFREDWGLQAGADFKIRNNVTLLLDVRYADYGNISVVSLGPHVLLRLEHVSQVRREKHRLWLPHDIGALELFSFGHHLGVISHQ